MAVKLIKTIAETFYMVTKNNIDERFRYNLIRLRLNAGLTQAELARWSGVNHIAMLENGSAAAGKDVISRLATALNVDVSEFYLQNQDKAEETLILLFRKLSADGKKACLEIVQSILSYDLKKNLKKDSNIIGILIFIILQ